MKQYAIPAACLVLSALVTYWSVKIGVGRSLTGEKVLVWLHVGAFLIAVGLVLVAILFKVNRKK